MTAILDNPTTTVAPEPEAPAEAPAPACQTFTVGSLTIEAADEAEALRKYKRMVRAEALKAQADQNWCNSGTNERLRILGLREVGDGVPMRVTVTATRTAYLSVDADTVEEATAVVAEGGPDVLELATASIGRGWTVISVDNSTSAPLVDDSKTRSVGDPDDTLAALQRVGDMPAGVASCEQYHERGYYCTMPRGHVGNHAAGNGVTIRHVWRNNLRR